MAGWSVCNGKVVGRGGAVDDDAVKQAPAEADLLSTVPARRLRAVRYGSGSQ